MAAFTIWEAWLLCSSQRHVDYRSGKKECVERAWILFLLFIWLALVYVVVAFTDITSSSFVGKVVLENGDKVEGGAIATSSLLYLVLPLIMGVLLKKTKLSLGWATAIFLPLVGLSIWIAHISLFLLNQF